MKIRTRILKMLILAAVAYAMVCMWHWLVGLTYFTELSNLFIAVVVLLQLFIRQGTGYGPLKLLKYMAVVSAAATGLAFLVALAPMQPGGFLAAYRQDHYASLCMHAVVPVLSVADFLLNDLDFPWQMKHAFLAPVPGIVYFLFVLVLGAAGYRWYQGMAAPYGFLNYLAPAGWFGFMPETFGRTTFGIGVFYGVLAFFVVFLMLGMFLIAVSRRLSRKAGDQ